MAIRRFAQVDVFSPEPWRGNPVAVVLDGGELDDAEMQAFARWTNLSETTFVLEPTVAGADYRVRIFTPQQELPFAGHPTLGTCHAWLEAGGRPAGETIVQECPAGLIEIRRTDDGLAFAAPPLIRSGPADQVLIERVLDDLGLARDEVLDVHWVDNGPGWLGVLVGSAARVLALEPTLTVHDDVGVVGLHPDGTPEIRAFFMANGVQLEDPVTGSLNASLAQWLLGAGHISAPYTARQGTAIERAGRIHVTLDDFGTIWIAGATTTVIEGSAEL
ncbi:MAG TPA: PhzF family phenazine biosynthesis protein [Solirubrobacteraceae bacterium]